MNGKDDIQTAADAFKAISNELRIAMLHELAQRSEPLGFSEFMDALDEPDSGRLNYHLQQLTPRYVTRTDDKYRLTIHGEKIVSSILASRYVEQDGGHSVSVAGDCYGCGATDLRLEQRGEQAMVVCGECGRKQFRKAVAPEIWKRRDDEAVPRALDRIVWKDIEFARDGLCGYCHSVMEPRVAENQWERDSHLYGFYDFDVVAVHECEQCTNWKYTPYGLLAWVHPKVRSFHRDLGIDPDAVRCWQIDQAKDAQFTTVESTDPYRISVSFPVEDAECTVLFDDRNDVVHVTQEWRNAGSDDDP